MNGTIVVGGAMAAKPGRGGHTWVLLQYLLGLRRLGWDVLFVDHLGDAQAIDRRGRECPLDRSWNVQYVRETLTGFGLGDRYAILGADGRSLAGLARERVLETVSSAAALLNVMGYISDEEILRRSPRRVFLDIDPGYPQMWYELGLADPFDGHDAFATFGARIGREDCPIPTAGIDWVSTRPPVVLERWPAVPSSSRLRSFRTVATWRGAYGPVEYRGVVYGQRVHEFRSFARLPKLVGRRFEVALDIDPADAEDLKLLKRGGWHLLDPRAEAGDPSRYQRFIRGAGAEFMVAKHMYVHTRGGWFSDRSASFLASGRPVLAEDTGLDGLYPVGKGLLTFIDESDALAAIDEVIEDYPIHARAARELAEECFDSDVVLPRLLRAVGVF